MLVYEMKLEGAKDQYERQDDAIRTGRFVRNSLIKAWMDGVVKSRTYSAYKYCKILADNSEFPWAGQLKSMARQAHAERAWAAIERFYKNGQAKIPGKKGYHKNKGYYFNYCRKFKKYQVRSSVEYKTSGGKLSEDRRYLKLTDKLEAGTFKLWGSRDLHYYQIKKRIIRRDDGYYAQFLRDNTREEKKELTGKKTGLNVGLNHFYTDSEGNKVDNPRFLRKDEGKIKKLQKRLARTKKGSKNRMKARNRLGREGAGAEPASAHRAPSHLKVSRGLTSWACKEAKRVIQSNDLVAIENLYVRNYVKNHHLAKSINDAAGRRFREWLEYFGSIYGVRVIAVEPFNTSQNCSNCGKKVSKTLSTRIHKCPHCGYEADRDENAAIDILQLALKQRSTTLGPGGSNNSVETGLSLNGETQTGKPTRRKRKSK